MIAEIVSPLLWNLIIITLIWVIGMIIIQISKTSLLKSLDAAAESEKDSNNSISEKIVAQKIRVKQTTKLFTIVITAITAITLLVYAVFMNNSRVKSENELNKIEQAPLPEKFKPQTTKEIEQSNRQSITEKPAALQQKATAANTKAMNDGISIFKKAK